MKKQYSLLILFLILASCTLSGDQEKKLNESVAAYLFSRNECRVVNYVAFTYPKLVQAYKSMSDSTFKVAFDCSDDTLFLKDPTVRQTAKDDHIIHVLYQLDGYNNVSMQAIDKKYKLVAISEDNGKSWFFMDWNQYVDKSLLPDLKRLLKD